MGVSIAAAVIVATCELYCHAVARPAPSHSHRPADNSRSAEEHCQVNVQLVVCCRTGQAAAIAAQLCAAVPGHQVDCGAAAVSWFPAAAVAAPAAATAASSQAAGPVAAIWGAAAAGEWGAGGGSAAWRPHEPVEHEPQTKAGAGPSRVSDM